MKKISNVIDILKSARSNGISISLDGGQLKLKFSKDRGVDSKLLEEIKLNKEQIIRFLNDKESKSSIDASGDEDLFSVERDPDQKIPLSYSQERLWFIDRLDASSVQYHIKTVLRLKGKLNTEALRNSLKALIDRHEVLRTVFVEEEGKVYQQINDISEWKLNVIENDEYRKDPEKLKEFVKSLISKPFDLSRDYMLRADLIKLREEEYLFVVTMHHIASDGWSQSILVKEVVQLYRSFDEGKESGMLPLEIQYADYAIWQRKNLTKEILDKKLDYWKNKLDNTPPVQLPIDFKRPSVQGTKGASYGFYIDKALTHKIQDLSQKNGATLFMTLLAAFNVLLYRYSGQQDICVGTVIAGRQKEALNGLIGFFVNTLALRNEINSEDSFLEILQQVRRTTIEAQEHQDVPFEKVVDSVVKERSLSISPLFQVMFVLQNTPESDNLILGDVKLSREASVNDTSRFELTLLATETPQGLNCTVEYSTELYKEQTIVRMTEHFKELLDSIVKSPEKNADSFSIITKQEEQKIFSEFNNTFKEYPDDKTIINLFEEHAENNPDSIALIFEDEKITYKELNEQSNRLAHFLQSKGVKKETIVGICIERNIDMITGILSVLKAGGAYVPIDPEYPEERINYMLEDSKSSIVLTSTQSRDKLNSQKDSGIIEIDGDRSEINKESSDNLNVSADPSDLSYVIYTSGSTGKPKGVMIENKNVFSFICWCKDEFKYSRFDIVYGSTSICFDLSIFEIFFPLCTGKPLRILENGLFIGKHLSEDKNVMTNCVPGVIETLLKEGTDFTNVNVINMAGEPISNYVQENLDTENKEVRNLYGPSEDTTYTTNFRLIKNQPLLIGKPISNTQIYILNKENSIAPVGVAGEICIAGAGLARGYLYRPELTAEKFVKDPFNNEGRIYRTGDLGRWQDDGNIEYLGRIDNQIKLRGFRIELGEIESVLEQSGLVSQVVVTVTETKDGIKRLTGYVVSNNIFDKEEILSYLGSRLPAHMIPALWIELESLPLTQNGKIDRKALPNPDADDMYGHHEYIAPRNEMEENFAMIWKDLLHAERVGIYDNFFELGGDSIITIQVLSRARRLGYELKPKDIFIHQNIASLSIAISERLKLESSAEQGILTGESGLIPIQKLYFEEAGSGESVSHFNQSVLLSLDKEIKEEHLKNAVEQIMSHHDALRFRYHRRDGQWEQEYGDYKGELKTVDLKPDNNDSIGKLIRKHSDRFQRSLDLEKGEIIRFVLFKTDENEKSNRLLIVIHHLAIDGVSWRIILDDLELILNGILKNENVRLGNKTSSFRQWYKALVQYGKSNRLLSQTNYWEKAEQNYKPLTVDKIYTGAVTAKDMKSHSMRLDSVKTQMLIQEVPRVYHTEVNDILLCAMALTLSEYGNTEKVVIGLEGHGREDIAEEIDTSRTVGWFTSLYPVLVELSPDKKLSDTIKSVKEQLHRIPDKGIGYGVLKYLNKEKKLSGKENRDLVFNYLGQLDNIVSSDKLLSGAGESKGSTSGEEQKIHHKIAVNGMVQGGVLMLNWAYSSLHFNDETISRIVEKYQSNLEVIISHCIEQGKFGSVYTPSDYGLGTELSYDELDKFLNEPVNGKARSESVEGLYRLSGLQQGMLFHGLYNETGGAYTEQLSCDLTDPDLEIIKKSWSRVLKNHTILRSSFYYDVFSIPVQCVYREVEMPLTVMDYSNLDAEKQAEAILEFEAADRFKSFDFKSAPLMRIALIRKDENHFRMIWTSHHILFDGWSLPILLEEFLKTYDSLLAGSEIERFEVDRFEDYIRYIERLDKEQQEIYWRNYLNGVDESTLLPFVEATSERTKGAGAFNTFSMVLDEEFTARIGKYAQKNRLTVNTLIQGVWSYLLHNYTGKNDVVYGVIVSGRPEDLTGVEHKVGMYINTLPLRSVMNKEEKITQWLQNIQSNQVSSRHHQYTPLNEIQGWTEVSGDLFDCILVFENYPVSEIIDSGKWSLNVENMKMKEQTNYPLALIVGSSEKIIINFRYNPGILEKEYVQQISTHIRNILNQIIEKENKSLKEIDLLSNEEKHKLLSEFNNIEKKSFETKNVIALFEEQASKNPDKTALIFEDKYLSFKDLNEQSNRLAHYLQSKGVKSETMVPVCIDKSIEMIIGILGIMKAGGAYVPIDTEYPSDGIKFILEDTNASVILSTKNFSSKFPQTKEITIVSLDADLQAISSHSNENLKLPLKPNQLAYVIYTSGSTGKPKGVLIEHRNLISYLLNNKTKYISDKNENSGSFIHLSYTFDASITGIFMPLINGKQIVIGSKKSFDVFEDPNLEKYAPYDFIKITPSHLELLYPKMKIYNGEALTEKLILGGEALYKSQINYLHEEGLSVEIINEYGPTEATVGCSTYSFNSTGDIHYLKNNISIGKPIENTQLYIVDKNNNLLPYGIPGELCIGGEGLARGYLNRSDLTLEKFIRNPFSDDKESRLYKTGDIAKWLPDGNIEFSGRKDDQIKIRGYRVELGEIENAIRENNSVTQVVVIAKESKEGNKRLIAYVIAKENFDKGKIISQLQNRLPEYMIPVQWVELDEFPLTKNGKLDRKALPDPEQKKTSDELNTLPGNDFEKTLVEIWQDLLDVENVGIHDNFFELGGDSIIIIQIVSRARRAGYDLQVSDVFSYQTISKLSEIMDQKDGSSVSNNFEQGLLEGASGLTPIQQWFFENAGNNSRLYNHFNQSVLLSIDKKVTSEILGDVVRQIFSHHDALRFIYKNDNGHWSQEYGLHSELPEIVDLRSDAKDTFAKSIKEHSDKYQRSLNIEKGEVAKFVLFQTPENEKNNRILIIVHHLAVDGVSWRILLDDIELLLSGKLKNENVGLGSKSSSYRQWYEALEEYGKSRKLLSQNNYWEKSVNSYEPLKVDKTFDRKVNAAEFKNQTIKLDTENTQLLLQKVPGVYHTEINDILLCALALTLSDHNSSDKIVVGLEGHGREDISKTIDTSRTVGWFTSMYPVLLELNPERNLQDSIISVKEQMRRVPDKGIGYGVSKYINKNEQISGKECWDVIFNYLGQLDNVVGGGKLLSGAGESKGAVSGDELLLNHKISVTCLVQNGEFILYWSYSSRHFEEKTISELVGKFRTNLISLISHCIEQEKTGSVNTPSDYGLGNEIDYKELDKFLNEPYGENTRRDSIEGIYRLSGLQQGMLFHSLFDKRAGAYTEQLGCDLVNPDLEIISKSWDHVLSRHSILRSGFYFNEFSIPVQCVYREVKLPVEILDYSNMEKDEQSEKLKEFESEDRIRGFDFKTVPLMRISLIRLSEDRYRMLWTSHHILYDGWSLPIIMEEFLSTYELLITGKEVLRKEVDKYEDFIKYIERIDKDEQEMYWRNYMEGVEQSTLLPFISPSKLRTKGIGSYESVMLRLNEEITSHINKYAQKHRITINTVMQGVWSYLLHRYTGSEDIVYGVIVSGRPDDLSGVEKKVGMYINTLPLHSRLGGGNKNETLISEWLQGIQGDQVSSRYYQYTPLQDVQRFTKVNGELFDSILVFENYPVSEIVKAKQWSLKVENLKIKEQTNYPLTIAIGSSDKININFSFNTSILQKAYVEEICEHFENVLMQIISDDDKIPEDIKLLTNKEEDQILKEFNNTYTEYPDHKNVIELFEAKVAESPDSIAVVYDDYHLTYKELDERSNQLAHYLQSKGVKAETLVPLVIERNPEMIISIFGIIKAGGAYVPIDPEYPVERIKFMLEDTGSNIVLSSRKSKTALPQSEKFVIISVDESEPEISSQSKSEVKEKIKPDQLIYIIYTSGSTGIPKGVMIEHKGVLNLSQSMKDLLLLKPGMKTLQFASIGFDASCYEIFNTVLSGGCLVLCNKEDLLTSEGFEKLINKYKVDLAVLPATFQNIIKDSTGTISTIVSAGEALNEETGKYFQSKGIRLINAYGPTETTVCASLTDDPIKENNLITIGKPNPNQQIYIFDKTNNLCPVGVAGEICVAGVQIARGYLNRPELNVEKFTSDPFSVEPGSRLYRTGDLGKWLPDGSVEFLGRIDDQVKIRGFRIELGEIESILNKSNLVEQAIVTAKNDKDNNKRLVGYIIPKTGFNKEEVMNYLRIRLPEYMVPAIWNELDSFPVTKSGKIDRNQLLNLDAENLIRNEYVEARNDTERKISEIWKELLQIERVGVYDNFFELGGHSLLAMRVITAIQKVFEIELAVKDLFNFTNISDLSKYLEIQKKIFSEEKDSEEYEQFTL